jgi:hypothetical protein
MHMTQNRIGALFTAFLLGAVSAPAWSQPAPLPVGGSVNPIPVYTGSTPPNIEVLVQLQNGKKIGDVTVGIQELVFRTQGEVGDDFAFVFSTTSSSGPLSMVWSGFGAGPGGTPFSTAIESCEPLSQLAPYPSASPCTAPGTATRSPGSGDTITFSDFGTTSFQAPGGPKLRLSNVYTFFTDAPAYGGGNGPIVIDNGVSFPLGALLPVASAPEPGSLGLMLLGLPGLLLAGRRRRVAPDPY